LKDHEHIYQYQASDVLYWTDRDAYLDELDNWNGEQLKDTHKKAIEYIFDSYQDVVFSDLVALIRRKKVAPFVGAGISAAAGYPSWVATLKTLGTRLTNVKADDIDR
jgi:hypothetical protein